MRFRSSFSREGGSRALSRDGLARCWVLIDRAVGHCAFIPQTGWKEGQPPFFVLSGPITGKEARSDMAMLPDIDYQENDTTSP